MVTGAVLRETRKVPERRMDGAAFANRGSTDAAALVFV
jgi:hypothetical protein